VVPHPKMGVAQFLKENRHSTDVGTTGMEAYLDDVYTFNVDTVIIFLHVTNTNMMSRGERKLDRSKRDSKCAANEAPTSAVPMHAPQTSCRWQGVGEVSFRAARVKRGVEEGYNQSHFEGLPRVLWEGFVNTGDAWFECSCHIVRAPVRALLPVGTRRKWGWGLVASTLKDMQVRTQHARF